ncbi:MerC domain-containing protein [uncultured Lacinutrix sp.]|uniref:MerC domain-containing protein n=1 Tax=uncultured Lacinutrix sp. TaxID=574032 RepID=UPI00262A53FA|nr:MerC domain-containing protein [uncultured Lacinutrix sp.]
MLGAIASTLCLIHCIATPFLFIVQTCSVTCCSAAPTWWQFIDYFFLIISFFAIYKSTQTSSNSWIKPLLWLSWFLLFLVIVNEKLEWLVLNDNLIYVPAIALVILHLYNLKYCKCNTNRCCISDE